MSKAGIPEASNRTQIADQEKDPFLDDDVTSTSNARKDAPIPAARGAKSILVIFGVLLGVALAVLYVYFRDTENSGQCPGNLVPLDCPCFTQCKQGYETAPVICPSLGECRPGCGCPDDKPFLSDSFTCADSCGAISTIKAKDFTDCPLPKLPPLMNNEMLFTEPNTDIFHYRIAPTYSCFSNINTREVDVLLHFTLLVRNKRCDFQPKQYFVSFAGRSRLTTASQVACLDFSGKDFDDKIKGAWFFYIARLASVNENSEVDYEVGVRVNTGSKSPTRTFISPLSANSPNLERPILVLGDTATVGARVVAASATRTGGPLKFSLAIHVGDASYATNKGDCWGLGADDPKGRCGYMCSGLKCHGTDKLQLEEMRDLYDWAKIIDNDLGGSVPWVSTMGNHDNDLGWFLTYRPMVAGAAPNVEQKYLTWTAGDDRFLSIAASNALKQSDAQDEMKNPHFFSFDHGLMHIVQIGTEDNPVNAYEVWDGKPMSVDLKQRWDDHYGVNSKQYNWLVEDLRKASQRRKLTPWLAIYTHRPMFHTAQHHPWCEKGGDWYGCLFVETYEPLLKQYGVDLFISGHSHHYQRSYPMFNQKVVRDGTVHLIVGVGGYEVVGEKWVRTPDWLAARQGTILGYARFWVRNLTHIEWEHVSAENDTVLDSAWIINSHVFLG